MAPNTKNTIGYKDAGVDIDAGNELVERIKPIVAATRRTGADATLGGFGGFFDLRAAGYQDPILVAANDGVGTKLKIAIETGIHNTVGIDLVAMCVNDLIVQGAEPLLFLDYFATPHLDVEQGVEIVSGIARGCELAGCALIGGETAELPGLYAAGDYDLAGFAIGAVERGAQLTGAQVAPGNIILGIGSSGLHSNGFSLVRKIVEINNLDYAAACPFDDSPSLGEALLEPTRIYVKSCLAAIAAGSVHALAHITGGGLLENIPRVLPDSTKACIELAAWHRPPVFDWLQETAGLEREEMLRTFNNGIGMAVVVPAEASNAVAQRLEEQGEAVFRIGNIAARVGDEPQVVIS